MFVATEEKYMPKIATKLSAGLDIFAHGDYIIKPGEVEIIKTGVFIDKDYVSDMCNPEAYHVGIYIRSSMAKRKLFLANGKGIIDIDYPDEIGVMIYNASNEACIINDGNKIAQMIVESHISHYVGIEPENTERTGGFGSTGQ